MVFHSSNQPHQRDQEQEDANGDDHAHHTETGNQPKADAPCSNSNQKQANRPASRLKKELQGSNRDINVLMDGATYLSEAGSWSTTPPCR